MHVFHIKHIKFSYFLKKIGLFIRVVEAKCQACLHPQSVQSVFSNKGLP